MLISLRVLKIHTMKAELLKMGHKHDETSLKIGEIPLERAARFVDVRTTVTGDGIGKRKSDLGFEKRQHLFTCLVLA